MKRFEEPIVEVTKLGVDDVITTSAVEVAAIDVDETGRDLTK